MRRRRGATVALILLVGLAGGVVLAAIAGASRTDSAMDRFVAFSRPEDVYVIVNGGQGDPPDPAGFARTLATRARVLALPQIAEAGRAPYVFMTANKHGADLGSVNPFASADAHAFRTIDRPLLLRGRLARLDRPDEVAVDDLDAAALHVRVGSLVKLRSFSAQQTQAFATSGAGKIPSPEGQRYTFRVVGIVRDPTTVDTPPAAIVRDASYQGKGRMLLTPAFLRRFARDQGVPLEAVPAMEGFRIRLRHGLADLAAFERGVRRVVSPGDGQVHLGSDIQTAADKAQRPIHLEAIALALFGAITGLAALLILGQALARQVGADTDDYSTLAALGADRRQLVAVPLGRAIIIGFAGAVVAIVVALVLSPLTPIGLARRAEIHPGFSVNWAVLVLGFLAIFGLVLLRAFVAAWRAARASQEHGRKKVPARPGPVNAAASGSGLGPPAVAGIAMAFERGRGVAFGTTLLGNLVAIAGVVAAVTFGASLHHLVDTPGEQGWNWDVIVGNPNSQALAADPAADPLHQHMVHLLATNKYVGSFSGLSLQDGITLDGHQVDLAAVETDRGSVFQPILEGRAPRSAHEIVLGRDTLAQLHKGVGQAVTVRAGDHHTTMRIVGVSLQPTAGDMAPRLSRGGSLTLAALRPLAVQTSVVQFAVRYRPGVRRNAASRQWSTPSAVMFSGRTRVARSVTSLEWTISRTCSRVSSWCSRLARWRCRSSARSSATAGT